MIVKCESKHCPLVMRDLPSSIVPDVEATGCGDSDRKLVGVWQHPNGGRAGPTEVIAFVEQRAMLPTACSVVHRRRVNQSRPT